MWGWSGKITTPRQRAWKTKRVRWTNLLIDSTIFSWLAFSPRSTSRPRISLPSQHCSVFFLLFKLLRIFPSHPNCDHLFFEHISPFLPNVSICLFHCYLIKPFLSSLIIITGSPLVSRRSIPLSPSGVSPPLFFLLFFFHFSILLFSLSAPHQPRFSLTQVALPNSIRFRFQLFI